MGWAKYEEDNMEIIRDRWAMKEDKMQSYSQFHSVNNGNTLSRGQRNLTQGSDRLSAMQKWR